MNANIKFDDQAQLTDALSSQKQMTDNYNTYANECSSQALKDVLMNILTDEHNIQHEVWKEMNTRGWYPTEAAEQSKIEKEKNKFANCCRTCIG